MDPKGKGMVINDKEKETLYVDEPKGDKATDSGSNNKGKDEKKRGTLTRSFTTKATPTPLNQGTTTMTHPRRRKLFIRIIHSIILACRTIEMLIYCLFQLVTPHFDGDDYSFWSHKMRSHLFSLHSSIWEIIESGMHFDSTDYPVFINEQIHKNAQV